MTDTGRLVDDLSDSWAVTHGKGALAVLSLVILRERECWAGELQERLREISGGVFDTDAASIHRMLRRLHRFGLLQCVGTQSCGPGAPRKIFAITQTGEAVLRAHFETTLAYLRSAIFVRAHEDLALEPLRPCECRCPDHGA